MSDLWDSYKVRTEKNLKDHLFQSPYFTDKETDFQSAEVAYPWPYSQVGAESRLRPSSFSSPHQDKVLCATSKVVIHYSLTWNQVNLLIGPSIGSLWLSSTSRIIFAGLTVDSLSYYCYCYYTCVVLYCVQDPFTFAIPFGPQKNPAKTEQALSLYFKWEQWDSEALYTLPKIP